MVNRETKEHSCQPILGLSRKTVKTIQFLAAVIGVMGVVIGFGFTIYEIQIQQRQRQLQLNTTLGNLAAQEKPEITSSFIHNNLKWMYREDFPITDINVTGTEFYMAKFENVDWQRVAMNEVEFACDDQAYGKISDWEEGDSKIPLCTRLKGADFTGASLREASFSYADLRGADFTAVNLSKAKIHDSVVSGAKFLEGIHLHGIEIEGSDFTNAQFSPEAKLRCTARNKVCVRLKRSDFSSAVMNDILIRGAEIDRVDFTNAKLEKARFDCEGGRDDGDRPCTILENSCGKGTVLTKARFKGIKISNVDFTGANLTKTRFEDTTISNVDFTGADLTGAKFDNVQFDRVELTKEQEKTVKKLDDVSLASLHRERREALEYSDSDEIPCSEDWNLDIKGWKDKFALAE